MKYKNTIPYIILQQGGSIKYNPTESQVEIPEIQGYKKQFSIQAPQGDVIEESKSPQIIYVQVPQQQQVQVEPQEEPTPVNTTKTSKKYTNKNEFISEMTEAYSKALKLRGINPDYASYLAIQDALESGFGKSYVGNWNYGNITVGSSGASYTEGKDHDGYGKQIINKFRNYDTLDDYINNKIDLLSGRRYRAFNGDISGFYSRVKAGGYAGDPNYVAHLNKLYGQYFPLKGKNGLKLPKFQNSGKLHFWSHLANQLQSAPSNGETTIAAHNADLNRQVEQARKEAKGKGQNPDRAEEEVYRRGLRTNGAIVGGAALGALATTVPAITETVKFATKTPVGKKALQKVMKDTAISMAGGTAVDALSDKMTGMSFGRYVAGAIPGARNLYDRSGLARFGIDMLNPGYLGLSGTKALIGGTANTINNAVEHIAPVQIRRIQRSLPRVFGENSEIATAGKTPIKWKHAFKNPGDGSYQNNTITSRLWTNPSITAHEVGHHISAHYPGLPEGNVMGAYIPNYRYGINTSPEQEAAEAFADYFRTKAGWSYKGKDPVHIARQRAVTNNLGDVQLYDVADPGLLRGKENLRLGEIESAWEQAVAKNDIAEAQRLSDLHFKIKAQNTANVDENGNLLKTYHGQMLSDKGYRDRYINPYSDKRTSNKSSGYFSTSSKPIAHTYNFTNDAPTFELYTSMRKPYIVDAKGRNWQNALGNQSTDKIFNQSISNGYDGIIIRNVDDVGIRSNTLNGASRIADDYVTTPGKAKLADAITYDDAGNIIPLSKRHDFTNPDIRYDLPRFAGKSVDTTNPTVRQTLVQKYSERYPQFQQTPEKEFVTSGDGYYEVGKIPFTEDLKLHKDLIRRRLDNFNSGWRSEYGYYTDPTTHMGNMYTGESILNKVGENGITIVVPKERAGQFGGFYNSSGSRAGESFATADAWRAKPVRFTQLHESVSHPTDMFVRDIKSDISGKSVRDFYNRVTQPSDLFPDFKNFFKHDASELWYEGRSTNNEMIKRINEIIFKKTGKRLTEVYNNPELLETYVDTNLKTNEQLISFLESMDNGYLADYASLLKAKAGTKEANVYGNRIRNMIKTLFGMSVPIAIASKQK